MGIHVVGSLSQWSHKISLGYSKSDLLIGSSLGIIHVHVHVVPHVGFSPSGFVGPGVHVGLCLANCISFWAIWQAGTDCLQQNIISSHIGAQYGLGRYTLWLDQ